MSRLRALAVAASVAGVVLLLSGCHPDTPGPSGSASTTTSTTPSPTPTPTTAAAPACTRDSLKITYQATDGTAGHFHGMLTFTNTGTATCSMKGYPIVYIGQPEAEETMGAASTNDTTSVPALVTVAPGAAAHAATTITDAGAVCQPVDTTYLIAAPPLDHPFVLETDGEHVYDVVGQGCNDDSVSLVMVGAITN